MPREVEIPARPSPVRWAALAIVAVLSAVVVLWLARRPRPVETVVRPSPDVIVAVRDLARLETASYHIEKVLEIEDRQAIAWGLIDAKDALLLVAVGEVVAGVDLEKIDDRAVSTDWAARRVSIRLAPPEIFHARLDNGATHVYSRKTDALAKRNESLEGEARKRAEQSMRQAAIDAGILGRARSQAERSLRATLRGLGFVEIEITWREPH
jgi:hypothetical protein